jgi:uridine kinase
MSKPYTIGVAGCTQSGKSTFSRKLEQALRGVNIKIFHIDDYHKPKDVQPRAASPVTGTEYIDFNQPISFDLPQLRADLQAEINANTVDIIIVEGTLILHDEVILPLLDLKLYVDARAEERAERYVGLYSQYHGHDFIKNSYADLVRYRMEEYVESTKWRADMIINGSNPSDKSVDMIVWFVKRHYQLKRE